MPLHHFLLIYDIKRQRLREAMDLGSDGEAAARAYSEYENQYLGNDDIEIVLVGADSLDTIRKTHAHYFGIPDHSVFEDLLART